ncbi:MAG: hypothetical protein K5872_22375 [Rhizobiaceae bacterium]|nr:hypothetical protein [Rhizobiaceae bacterium]MCV0408968.1 hypothetical protein [Rhizobiaceae bacterium]
MIRTSRSGWNWLYIVIAGWATVIAMAAVPASWWFEVHRVHVHDGVALMPPVMEVERTIHYPFRGRWIVTVLRQRKDGRFYTYCTARGVNDYQPDNDLPEVVDLDWWTGWRKCPLPEGRYVVKTLWTIHPQVLPDKEVRVTSNVFEVR